MENEQRIRVRTSIPSLQEKVQTKIDGSTEAIFWYIRFNIPLDERSVSEKTMNITDTEGYIMRTDISFNKGNNTIAVLPLDTYEENRFYLLNISKKVRSAKGNNLKSTIHILFKLVGNQVTNYQVLKKNVKVPEPQPRPKDYDQRMHKPSRFDQDYIEQAPLDRMTTVDFSINPVIGIIGIAVSGLGLLLGNIVMGLIGVLLCAVGITHLIIQLQNDELRSKLFFNRGVRLFNRERYREAERAFKKAMIADPDNELAKYGAYKSELYHNGGQTPSE